MKPSRRFAFSGAGVAFALVLLVPSIASAQVNYHIRDITAEIGLSGGQVTLECINNAGQIAVRQSVRVPGTYDYVNHAFLWDPHAGLTQCNGYSSTPFGLNDAGTIAGGYHANDIANIQAAIWSAGNVTALNSLGYCYDINNANQAVGTGPGGAFLWDPVNGYQVLGLMGGTSARPTAINNLGQVLAYVDGLPGHNRHAVIWDNGTLTDLGVMEVSQDYSYPIAINEAGQVIGESRVAPNVAHPFLWDPVHGMRDLLSLGFPEGGHAIGINNHGQIVGHYRDQDNNYHAFVWDNGVLSELGTLPGGTSATASAINDQGTVVGGSNGIPVVWDVPEPGCTVLLLAGALAMLRRRKPR